MTVSTRIAYHGGGRLGVKHRVPTPEGELEIQVQTMRSRYPDGGDAKVMVFTSHHEGRPNTTDRLGRERILGWWCGRP